MFFRVTTELISPQHEVRRVLIDKHPKHKRRRQVGICGATWEAGWSPIVEHDLTPAQLKEVGRKLQQYFAIEQVGYSGCERPQTDASFGAGLG